MSEYPSGELLYILQNPSWTAQTVSLKDGGNLKKCHLSLVTNSSTPLLGFQLWLQPSHLGSNPTSQP